MKGIILISDAEKSGAFIDIQFPSLLCDVEEINPSELVKLYVEQKEKKVGPSYFEMKLKEGVDLAFFYTGSSLAHYVGRPEHAILVLISEDDVITENLEGMIRRIAHELLPQRDETVFQALFQDYYDLLKNGELGPYWDEIGEKQESHEDLSEDIKESTIKLEIQNKEKQIPEANELSILKERIKEQEEKFENWSRELASLNENNANLMNKLKLLKEESYKQKEFIEEKERETQNLSQLLEEAQEKIEKMDERAKDISELQKITEKSNELTIEIEQKDNEINELKNQLGDITRLKDEIDSKINEIDSLKKENENLKNDFIYAEKEIERLKNENERFLNTFTSLKLELKQTKEILENENKNNEKLKDEVIDMKKEVKVLRRERDHYKNIVKEKNLL